jgi:peptidoglycan/LPS O-acetylase OafA/YrhL
VGADSGTVEGVTMATVRKESNHIPSLDGWRGVAILLVLVDHSTETLDLGRFDHFLRLGATGVALFFALSGFLITTRLMEEKQRQGSISLKKFYVRRVFRLIPASLTYLLVLGALTLAGIMSVTREQWLGSLFFFRNYIPMDLPSAGWYTAHFWSLAIEEHFYLIWPTLLIVTGGRAIVPAILAAAVACWRFTDLHYHVVQARLWFPGRTDVRLDGLLWGCALAIVLMRPGVRQWMTRFYSWWLWLACLALYLIGNLLSGRHNYSPYEPALIALIMIWPVLRTDNWLARLLDLPVLKWIGHLSYSLYVWQQLWLVFPDVPTAFGVFQRLPLNVLCVFASASLSYYFIEKPMVNLGHRLTSGRRVTAREYSAEAVAQS